MGRYRAGIETRERILDATRSLLGEVGFEGTTIKAICERAGIRSGSFYNLFPTKDEAVLTVLREAITAVDPDPAGAGSDSVADLVHAYVRFIVEQDSLSKIYLQLAVTAGLTDEHLRARMSRHHQRRVERFADAIAREYRPISPATARFQAITLIAALNGLAYQWALDPSFDFREYADEILAERVGIA